MNLDLDNELNIEHSRVFNAIASYKNNQCVCENEKIEGKCRTWYPQEEGGQLWEECVCENGKLEGKYRAWHKNGKLHTECMFKNGELEGELKQWGKSGRLWRECMFKNGKLEGKFKQWKRTKIGGEYYTECVYKDNTEREYKKYYRFLNGGQLCYDRNKQFYTEN